MGNLQAIAAQDVEFFQSVVGKQYVISDPKELAQYGRDWTSVPGNPGVCILPATTEDVSKLLTYCNERSLPVVPNGGRTGLAGGGVANASADRRRGAVGNRQ